MATAVSTEVVQYDFLSFFCNVTHPRKHIYSVCRCEPQDMLGDLCTSAKTLLRGEILCLYSIRATNLVDANACMELEYSFDCLIVITNLFVLMIHLSVYWIFGADFFTNSDF